MKIALRQISIHALAAILLLQVLTLPFSSAVSAQGTSSADATPVDSIQGQQIMSGAMEEYYYWDMEEKDGQEVPVIYGRGGQFKEPAKFENAPGQPNSHFYYLKDEWLPVALNESWCGNGIYLKEKDGHPSNLVFRIVDNGDAPYDNSSGTTFPDGTDPYIESVYGRSAGVIDAIGDKSGGIDTYDFQWRAAVDISNPDEKKFIKAVGFWSATGTTITNILKNLVGPLTKELLVSEGFPEDEAQALEDAAKTKTKTIESCSYIFKDSFHVSVAQLSPFDVVGPNAFAGKLLGKQGMKFEDWLRHFNNMRDYFALSESATRQTTIHCNNFQDSEGCINRLTTKFQRCYARAIGIKDTSDFDGSKNPIIGYDDAVKKFPLPRANIWDHTIRANLAPFTTCFGGDRYAKSDTLDKSFRSEQQGIDFGEWIAYGAVFPEQLYPYDVEEVSDPTIPRGKAETTCSLGKMGWILCPVLKFFATITDRLFVFISQWLVIPPLLSGNGMAAFVVWEYMRNLANVLFVIMILALVIIYAAGGMLTNYNIRTMLPRLIVTGLLINISFYLCSFLVDVSNVTGSSLYSLIRDITPPKSGVSEFSTWESIVSHIAFAGGGAIVTAGAMLAGLAALIPMLIIALISMIVVLVTLLLRQAAVIILVIIAPLAIALQLLPGTSTWFQKWKKMLTQMLFLYPVIAIVFSGAYFASNVIQGQAAEQGSALMAIFALAIQIIPLFLTPVIMKFGGSALNNFGGAIKSAVKAPTDKVNNAAKTMADDNKDKRNIRAAHRKGLSRVNPIDAIRRSRMRREHLHSFQDSQKRSAQAQRIAKSGMLGAIAKAGGGINDSDLQGILDRAASERINLAKIALEDQAASQLNNDMSAINTAMLENLHSSDPSLAAASAQQIIDSDDINAINQLIETIHSLEDNDNTRFIRDKVVSKIQSSSAAQKFAHLRDPDNLNAIKTGTATTRTMYQTTANRSQGGYADPQVAIRESAQSINAMSQHLNDAQLQAFVGAFNMARSKDRTSGQASAGSVEAVAAIEAQLRSRSQTGATS